MNATQGPLCGCGCGTPAGVYKTSNSFSGIVAGQPKRFVNGHQQRVQKSRTRPFDECYTVQPDGCWYWNDVRDDEDGYGKYWVNRTRHQAHRFSYERSRGPIPAGAHVDHLCHNPKTCAGGPSCPHRSCVNPNHLAVSTHAANCRRGVLAKLTMEQAREIRARRRNGETGIALAEEFGVLPSTICEIHKNRSWREDVT